MAERINNTREGGTRRPHHSQTLSSKQFDLDHAPIDELIVSLADARENRRARQVGEWERMYRGARMST
jgi:hypothetical protein